MGNRNGSSLSSRPRIGLGSFRTGSSGSLTSTPRELDVEQGGDKLLEALVEEFGAGFEQDVMWRLPLADLPFHRFDHVVVFRGSFMGPNRDHVSVVALLKAEMELAGQNNVMFLVFPSASEFSEEALRRELPIADYKHQLLIRWMIDNRLLMTGLAFSRPITTPDVFVCSDDFDANACWDRIYRQVCDAVDAAAMDSTALPPRIHYMFGLDSLDSVLDVTLGQKHPGRCAWPLICFTQQPLSLADAGKVATLNGSAAYLRVYVMPKLAGHTGAGLRRALVDSGWSSVWKEMIAPCLVPAVEKVLNDPTYVSAAAVSAAGSGSRTGSPARFCNE